MLDFNQRLHARANAYFRASLPGRIAGALVGAIARPLLNVSLIALAAVVLSVKSLIKYYNWMREPADCYAGAGRIRSLITTLVVGSIFVPLILTVGAIGVAASIILSPFIGFFEGFRLGWTRGIMSGNFPAKVAIGVLKEVNPFSFRREDHLAVPQVNREQALQIELRELEARQNYGLFEGAWQRQAVQHEQQPQQQDDIPWDQIEEQERQIEGVLNQQRQLEFQQLQAEMRQPRNLVRNYMNALRPINDVAAANLLLVEEIKQLTNNQAPLSLSFISAEQLDLLQQQGNDEDKAAVRSYKALIDSRNCALTATSIDGITHPITIEYTKKIGEHNEHIETFIMVHDVTAFIEYLEKCAQTKTYPIILQQGRENYPIDRLSRHEGSPYIETEENSFPYMRIYAGIDTPTYQLLESKIVELEQRCHRLLNGNAVPPEVAVEQEIEGAAPAVQPLSSVASVAQSLSINNQVLLSSKEKQRQLFIDAYKRRHPAGRPLFANVPPVQEEGSANEVRHLANAASL